MTEQPHQPFSASFQGWTANPDDLEDWPNTVSVEATEYWGVGFQGEVTEEDEKYADFGDGRHLVLIDTNYKPTREGQHPVRLTRTDAAQLAAAVLEAIGDTFTSRHLGSLRTAEAVDLMLALETVATTLQRLRRNALVDLAEELEPESDDVDDAETAGENLASGNPVSTPIPALAPGAEDEPPAAEPPAEDAGEVTWTLEQQFGDALGAIFTRDLHEIASSDAYGALKFKVLHRCQRTGETPRQVLDTISTSDRAFVARANDPAAFLASRIEDER
jgi:hypothetical protein